MNDMLKTFQDAKAVAMLTQPHYYAPTLLTVDTLDQEVGAVLQQLVHVYGVWQPPALSESTVVLSM